MPRARAFALSICLATVLLPDGTDAAPAPGTLTPRACIQDVGRTDCGTTQHGLDEPFAVVTSPDGRSVYVVSSADDSIARFERNTETGALTPAGCIQDVGRTDCGVTQQGLDGPEAVAVSPDGRSVYVASLADDAVVRFDRNPTTGALTGAGCIQDFARLDCGTMQEGLDAADGVAVSPDGRSVYVGAFADDAIVRFDRNTTTGALTPAGCIQDVGRLECGTTQQGLDAPGLVTVSPDGRSVYAATYGDGAVVRFDRNPTTGALTGAGCIQDVGKAGCATTQPGLDGAFGIGVSPDGLSVYVASFEDDAIVSFNRDPTSGALAPAGCIQDVGRNECPLKAHGLDGADWIAVSADGLSVYTQGVLDDAVVTFDRNTGTTAPLGALTGRGCIQDLGQTACGPTAQGLDGAAALVSTPDGRSLYVVSVEDDAIVHFDREPRRPDTQIQKGPKKRTTKRRVTFAFTSDLPDVTFECSVDTGRFSPCASPTKLRARLGRHTFQVRAIDRFGNVDVSPARRRWRVIPR